MSYRKLFVFALIGIVAAIIGSNAIADQKDTKVAGQQEMKLPPGWTMEDMQACIVAGTPGKMHEELAKDVGDWTGKCTMWMTPDGEATKSECTMSVKPMMDGRYVKSEMAGEMPGMGPYTGLGISGFDNVSQKFVSTWIDNHSTGMMTGTGELSPDGKKLAWTFNFNCPLTKKGAVMRQIDTNTSATTKRIEMFGPDPKTGKEYKMMDIELTK